MAGSFSDFWEDKILNHIFGKATYTAPSNIFVGLSTTDPTDSSGNVTEPPRGASLYARVSTAPADWLLATLGYTHNLSTVAFPEAGASWGTVTHFALFDQATGGHLLAYGTLTASKAVAATDTVQFNAEALVVTLD